MTFDDIRKRAIAENNADTKSLIGEIERLRSTYMRDYAARMLDVRPSVLDFFEVRDPLNPQNEVLGFLSHQADHRYGALAILQVNGHDCPQVIFATPKLHYPFAKDVESNDRRYHWPVCIKGSLYEKADGTSVCWFSYADHNGKRFVTAKVRLGPFLRNGKFGPFLDMWKEMAKWTNITPPPEVVEGKYAYCFEMYGYRNLITVKYPFPLRIMLLFGVDQQTARVLVPEDCPGLPGALKMPCQAEVDSSANLTAFYEEARAQAGEDCRENLDGEIEGIEGYVLYLLTQDKRFVPDGTPKWIQLKCKPSQIEELHWSSDVPSYKSILPTVWNALETVEVEALTYNVVKQLLLEEFAEDKIEAAKVLVEKAIAEVKRVTAFRAEVKLHFEAAPDRSDKRTLMRYMSQYFTRELMKKVYSTMIQQGLWKELERE